MIFKNTDKFVRAKELFITTCVNWIPLIAGGVLIRKIAYRSILKKMGTSVYIQAGVDFTGANKVEIGSKSFIARNVSISLRTPNSKVLIGAGVKLDIGVIIVPSNDGCCIEVDDRTFIGPYTCLSGPGNVKIGKDCLIAAHSGIIANNHIFSDPDEAIVNQGVTCQGIVIEDNCWLGYGVKVLDGVTIGEGSVIGAGAVVTKDIPPYSVAVGVPAKVVRSRRSAKIPLARR